MTRTKLMALIESEINSKRELNVSKFARKVGVDRTTMCAYLANGRGYTKMNPRCKMALGLAEYFSKTPEEISKLNRESASSNWLSQGEQASVLNEIDIRIDDEHVPNVSLSWHDLTCMAEYARVKRAPMRLSLLLILLRDG